MKQTLIALLLVALCATVVWAADPVPAFTQPPPAAHPATASALAQPGPLRRVSFRAFVRLKMAKSNDPKVKESLRKVLADKDILDAVYEGVDGEYSAQAAAAGNVGAMPDFLQWLLANWQTIFALIEKLLVLFADNGPQAMVLPPDTPALEVAGVGWPSSVIHLIAYKPETALDLPEEGQVDVNVEATVQPRRKGAAQCNANCVPGKTCTVCREGDCLCSSGCNGSCAVRPATRRPVAVGVAPGGVVVATPRATVAVETGRFGRERKWHLFHRRGRR